MSSFATATRTDGGFFVRDKTVLQAPRAEGGTPELVALFSGLFVEAHPRAPTDLANLLNSSARLPLVKAPAKAVKREAAHAVR